ncbi:MAG: lysophospholipid acyltransferase family protein [Armatimonadota bacterium]|nr:1-acyl-sn-glycerol-3-phosphate acyltransferase [Armatimonadota bacterium]MCX7777186.1 1-acyl-sn-glycerol-3-phosphate acyltransferase [Armatimonadota bacterium]MDW8025013.1 lysophospholipid acyltransferase family protein [Armatimonadota bacterium]
MSKNRDRYKSLRILIYRVLMPLLRVAAKLLFGLKVHNAEKVPRSGGIIIASNHPTYLDPLFIGCACRRRVSFVAKRPIFDIPLLRSLLWLDDCIPVSRSASDVGALRECVRRLRDGEVIVIFPEGTRSNYGRMRQFTHGAALLAQLSGCPILPCAIINAYPAWRMSAPLPRPHWRVEVRFGEPMVVERCDSKSRGLILRKLTEELMAQIRQLGAN